MMTILQSLIGLCSLLIFFSILGLGITSLKIAKNNFALIPLFGYATVISLAYVISANFKISGATAVGYSILLLTIFSFIRIKNISKLLKEAWQDGELAMFFTIIAIPIFSLIFPAILIGFKYFYAYVNYDFFYNSQDSWFLQTHNIIQYNIANDFINPLNWSANYSGRIAVVLLGAFFSKFLNLDVLTFNSLLLNTIVILFALSMSVFCKEFFNLKKKGLILAVFFSVMSAGYVQGYSYYVLGQISVIPVFIIFCIFLKKFLDSIAEQNQSSITSNTLIIALLFNTLFIMYAIVSIFAACIMLVTYFLYFGFKLKSHLFHLLIKTGFITVALFCLIRILIVPESLEILKSWISLSNRVAEGAHGETFIVFSEYLTETFPALLFGLTNYVSTSSIFQKIVSTDIARVNLLFTLGIIAFLSTMFILKAYVNSSENLKSSRVIIGAIFGITITLTICFFVTASGYGIFKVQTWFMPILIPLYIYFLAKANTTIIHRILKIGCISIIALNFIASLRYINDFFVPDTKQHFVNVHGITGNKDISDIVAKLKSIGAPEVSIFLTNGMETAWVSHWLRNIKSNKVIHNTQVLNEKEFNETSPTHLQNSWPQSGLMILANPQLTLSDITDPPKGGSIIYSNKSYMIVDPKQLKTLIYIGGGSYPIEYFPKKNNSFPSKFRWVEKGIEIIIYSDKNRTTDLLAEVTPGFVENKNLARNIVIKTEKGEYKFSIVSKTTLVVPNLNLHAGLNYLTIQSPDKVSRYLRQGALMRSHISLDPRLNNFALSYIGLKDQDLA